MDRLSGLAVFAQVVEARSFTGAARQLGLSKSAVSKQVAGLEDRLGARLLNRTTRRLSLTEVGAAFYERCTRIIAEAEEAELAVGRLQSEPRGRLRLNAPVSFGHLHVAPAIADFTARYPEVTVDMTLNDRYVDVVDEGYDLVIRIADLPDSSLIARRLAPIRIVACASAGYLARAGTPRRPRDLADHNCLIYNYQRIPEEWTFTGPEGAVAVRVAGSLRANNGDAMRVAALHGLGIAQLPSFVAGEDLREGRLQQVLPDYAGPESSVFALFPHSRHLSAKVRAFVDFLVERIGAGPAWDDWMEAP